MRNTVILALFFALALPAFAQERKISLAGDCVEDEVRMLVDWREPTGEIYRISPFGIRNKFTLGILRVEDSLTLLLMYMYDQEKHRVGIVGVFAGHGARDKYSVQMKYRRVKCEKGREEILRKVKERHPSSEVFWATETPDELELEVEIQSIRFIQSR